MLLCIIYKKLYKPTSKQFNYKIHEYAYMHIIVTFEQKYSFEWDFICNLHNLVIYNLP